MGFKKLFILFVLVLSIVAGSFGLFKSSQRISEQSKAHKISSSLKVYLNEITPLIDKQVQFVKAHEKLSPSPINFILLKGDSINQWTDNHFIPPIKALTADFEKTIIKISSGDVLAIKKNVVNGTFLIAIIPLHVQYKITNAYLPVFWNSHIFSEPVTSILEEGSINGFPIQIEGKTLFKVSFSADDNLVGGVWSHVVVISFLLIIVCSYLLSINWFLNFSKVYPAISFIALAFLMVVIRMLMLKFDFPSRFMEWELFDPTSFASSEFNPSLGDLFLNTLVVFFLCLYLLFRFKYFSLPNSIANFKLTSWVVSVLYTLSILFAFLYLFVVVQTIYNNSTLSFSLFHSLTFNALRIVALLAIVISGISIFMFIHVFVRLLAATSNWIRIYFSFFIGIGLFICINTISQQTYISSLIICLIYLGLVFGFSLHRSLSKLHFVSFAYLFVSVISLSGSGVYAIEYFEDKRALNSQITFAENVLNERDYFGEYLLQESATKIIQDAFIQTRISSPFLSKEPVGQKITQVLLSSYFSRYSIKVLYFNASGEPLGNDKTTFYEWSKAYDTETYKTDYKNVFYIANETTDYAPKYLTFIPIAKNNSPLGFIVLELSLKRVIPENVYPELLVDNRFQKNINPNLSYALIVNNQVKYSTGDFNYTNAFKEIINNKASFVSGLSYRGQLHISAKDQLGRFVIVSEPVKAKMSWVVNFSFLLILGLLVISFVLLGYWVFVVSKTEQLNLATRIQLILNLAFLIPLVSVSIITLGLTTRSVQTQLEDDYLSKARQISPALAEAKLNAETNGVDFDEAFTSIVNKVNIDVNLFSLDGKLLTSSQPLIFENQLLSPYINHNALLSIKSGENLFIQDERVGDLTFSVAYASLLSPVTGEQLGIIAVPFFQSLVSLEKLQVTVLGNILSIFTMVFIVLVFVSFIVTKWLTSPLQFITNTLGKISLTRENTPLEWSANDEVGMMVNQYNTMLAKLEESKRELERRQREQAWREIAQQVAHEIKNPLTPMKLTLQQLERSIDKNLHDSDTEKLRSSVASLLTNLNSLNDIASSFSSFAKMPTPVISEIDLLKIIQKAINSFKEECSISLSTDLNNVRVLADEKILNRVFINLILNSIQASHPERAIEIKIRIESIGDCYKLTFEDNGKGIEQSMRDKIFLPHFTTKKSGSGLGLAITKESITQLGGSIYFETSDSGTRFFIELKKGVE